MLCCGLSVRGPIRPQWRRWGASIGPSKMSGRAVSARAPPSSMNYRLRRDKYVLLMDNHHATHAFGANFRIFTTRPQERFHAWRSPSSPDCSSCVTLGDLADGSSCRARTAPRDSEKWGLSTPVIFRDLGPENTGLQRSGAMEPMQAHVTCIAHAYE